MHVDAFNSHGNSTPHSNKLLFLRQVCHSIEFVALALSRSSPSTSSFPHLFSSSFVFSLLLGLVIQRTSIQETMSARGRRDRHDQAGRRRSTAKNARTCYFPARRRDGGAGPVPTVLFDRSGVTCHDRGETPELTPSPAPPPPPVGRPLNARTVTGYRGRCWCVNEILSVIGSRSLDLGQTVHRHCFLVPCSFHDDYAIGM